MQRFTYSPKVYAYVKADMGVVDLTDFIVSGTITRRMSAVSDAEVTLRNPNFRFTKTMVNNVVYPVFHPMDPITIFMERQPGYPVQVFTGYLDQSPYLQLFPGTVTLKASCTLKRVLQTYYNPALFSTISLMQKMGWYLDPTSGMYYNPEKGKVQTFAFDATGNQQTKVTEAQLKQISQSATDAGFGKLMETVLVAIGGWDLNHVHILDLPNGIVDLVTNIFSQEKVEASAQAKEFREFIAKLIGQGNTLSTGPGTSGASAGATPAGATQQNVQTVCQIAQQNGIPPEFVLAVIDGECGFDPHQCSHASGCAECGCCGWFQWSSRQPYPGQSYPSCQDAYNLPTSTQAFCKAAKALQGQYGNDWYAWANKTQGCGVGGGTGNCYGNWGQNLAQGKSLVQKYCSGGSGGSPSAHSASDSSSPNTFSAQVVASASRAPSSGRGGNSPHTNSNNVINPIPGFSGFSFDYGIDCAAPIGSAILAPADCTVVGSSYDPRWFQGTYPYLAFRFDNPLPNAPSQHWYISEGIRLTSTADGHHFKQGDTVATYTGPPIEIGWASDSNPGIRLGQARGLTDHAGGAGNNSGNVYGRNFYNFFSVGTGSPQQAGNTGTAGGAGGGTAVGADPIMIAKAVAFGTLIQGPTLEQEAETQMLTGRKGLMLDQSLLPFIQQLAQACLREFMSLPNGDFIAFYPDYFGGLQRQPYWEVRNIEIMDGSMQLSDDPLVTHLYVIGDLIPFTQGDFYANLYNEMATTGVVTLVDAINADFINGSFDKTNTMQIQAPSNSPKKSDKGPVNKQIKGYDPQSITKIEWAYNFLKKYGARPLKLDMPYIRAPFYETFYAYQQFCLRWSQQFQSAFRFTFMPELFPGGIVALPDHGLQFYVQEVVHTFDYTNGFETNALLMAPAAMNGPDGKPVRAENVNINQGLIRSGSFTPGPRQ